MFNGQEHTSMASVDFRGMYMAEVIDQVDPSGSSTGRVKVRVFPMMSGLDEEVLPWAVPAMPLFEGGSSDAGAFVVPATGSKVWVFFAAGDVRNPVYFAAALGMSDGPSDATDTKKVWKTRSGHKITIDDTDGSEVIEVLHKGGEKIVLTEDGVQLGKGSLKKLVNETFRDLFDAHVHEYGAYPGSASNPVAYKTSVPNDPLLPPAADPLLVPTGTAKGITDAELTEDTKAS